MAEISGTCGIQTSQQPEMVCPSDAYSKEQAGFGWRRDDRRAQCKVRPAAHRISAGGTGNFSRVSYE